MDTVVGHYLKGDSAIENYKEWKDPVIKKDEFELLSIGVRKKGGTFDEIIRMDDEIEIVLKYRIKQDLENFYTVFHIKNERGEKILTSTCSDRIDTRHKCGLYEQKCIVPAGYFNWGNLSFDFHAMRNKKILLTEEDIVSWTIVNNATKEGNWMGRVEGDIIPDFNYTDILL